MPDPDGGGPARPRGGAAPVQTEVTRLLRAWGGGDVEARDRVFAAVYGELRRLAASYLRRERSGHSLQPTTLVHEAFLKLAGARADWQDRAHFFGVAARAMRRILVDHARRRRAGKRGRGAVQITLDEAVGLLPARDLDVVRVDEALKDLAALDPRQEQVVELRFFGGLSVEETAAALALSPATVKRDWTTAKAWIARYLLDGAGAGRP